MARAVGIELAEENVKILSFEQDGKKGRILQFHKAPIPGGETPWEERAGAALREALAVTKVPKGRVVASLESGDAILREITLPFKNEDQIRKTVRFELESLIHNYTIEDLIVSHYKTGETDKGTHLIAAAVPKEVVGRRLKVLQDAGVDPVAIDLDVCAVFNAMLHTGAIDTDAPHLLIYGTSKFTKLVFIEEKQPRSIRTIRFSLPPPGPGQAAPPPLTSGASAKEGPPKPGPPAADAAPGRPEPFVIVTEEESRRFTSLDKDTQGALVGILAKEISRFLLASASSASPAHILLSGDFEDERAARLLEQATRIPVRTFNFLSVLEPPPGDANPAQSAQMGASLGLALKGAGIDALGMDFRQEEFQYRKRFEALKTTALVTVELAIVFLAAVALHFWFKQKDLKRDLVKVHRAHLELYESVAEKGDPELSDGALAFEKVKDKDRAVRAAAGTELPIRISARQAWKELFRAIGEFQRKFSAQQLGEGSIYLELDNLDIQQTTSVGNESLTMSLRGKARNHDFASALLKEIRAVEIYKGCDWNGPQNPTPDGMVQVNLKAVHKGR